MNRPLLTNCGTLVEANLQTPEELAAERVEPFEKGDALCWGDRRPEKCSQIGSPPMAAMVDDHGKPMLIRTEPLRYWERCAQGICLWLQAR